MIASLLKISQKIGVDTKQRLSKQRLLQNSDTTKQQLLQNSDSYKTATVTKQRLLQNSNLTVIKRWLLQKNILIYSTKTLGMLFISLIYFDIYNKNNFVIFLKNRKGRFL